MKILIIGSEGFIGSHLVKRFIEISDLLLGCDLLEAATADYEYKKVSRLSPEWDEVLRVEQFDYCINASGSGNVNYSMTHPHLDFEANTLDVLRLLDALRKYQPACKFIHISSAAVYGNPVSIPINEASNLMPLSPYGWHKYMSELVCKEYYQLFNIKNVIVRPFSVYGQGLRKQLLWDICSKTHNSSTVDLFGTGKESRDFIHVTDLVYAIECIINKATFQSEIYNLAGGQETTIQELATIFESYFNGKVSISFSGKSRAGDPLNWLANIDKIKSLGFTPKINLAEGVFNYIDWVKSVKAHQN